MTPHNTPNLGPAVTSSDSQESRDGGKTAEGAAVLPQSKAVLLKNLNLELNNKKHGLSPKSAICTPIKTQIFVAIMK